MKLYDFELSGNCYKVRLFLSLLDIPYESVLMDLQNGAQRLPEYTQLNPKQQVPTLVDGEAVIPDSHAILIYLATKHGGSKWYPADAETRARIQFWMITSAREIQDGVGRARLMKLFNAPGDPETVKANADKTLALLDAQLAKGQWLAADHITIADLVIFPYVALAGDGDIPLEPYAHVRAWISRIQGLERFIGMPGIAETTFA